MRILEDRNPAFTPQSKGGLIWYVIYTDPGADHDRQLLIHSHLWKESVVMFVHSLARGFISPAVLLLLSYDTIMGVLRSS
jgi:hypothetical protein